MLRGVPIAAAAALTVATAPAVASAAAIATDAPCYLSTGAMTVAGQGFAPGLPVNVESSGLFGTGTADAAGNVSIATAAPVLSSAPDVKVFTLTGSDGTNTAQTTFRVSSFAASHGPASRPSSRVRWSVAGFAPGRRVYAHYVHGGRQAKRVSFGRMPNVCGVLHRTLAVLPISNPARGRWRIQLDTRKAYSAKTTIKLVTGGTVSLRVAG
jgi:hypothetical protein